MSKAEQTEMHFRWYAIRVTYSREMMVKSYLDGIGTECYVPMHFAERTYGALKRKVWTPLIHNLLFVRSTAENLRVIKAETDLPIRYIIDRESGEPIVIPDRQMQDFMAVIATKNKHVEIVEAQTIDLMGGDRVRVTGGIFAGIEGCYVRHKGHSKVAVTISNIATALTAYVPAKYIEKLIE